MPNIYFLAAAAFRLKPRIQLHNDRSRWNPVCRLALATDYNIWVWLTIQSCPKSSEWVLRYKNLKNCFFWNQLLKNRIQNCMNIRKLAFDVNYKRKCGGFHQLLVYFLFQCFKILEKKNFEPAEGFKNTVDRFVSSISDSNPIFSIATSKHRVSWNILFSMYFSAA